jgi:FCD domain
MLKPLTGTAASVSRLKRSRASSSPPSGPTSQINRSNHMSPVPPVRQVHVSVSSPGYTNELDDVPVQAFERGPALDPAAAAAHGLEQLRARSTKAFVGPPRRPPLVRTRRLRNHARMHLLHRLLASIIPVLEATHVHQASPFRGDVQSLRTPYSRRYCAITSSSSRCRACTRLARGPRPGAGARQVLRGRSATAGRFSEDPHRAGTAADAQELSDMPARRFQAMESTTYLLAVNRDIHVTVAAAAANSRRHALVQRLLDECERASAVALRARVPGGGPRVRDEHRALLAALRAADKDTAERAMATAFSRYDLLQILGASAPVLDARLAP